MTRLTRITIFKLFYKSLPLKGDERFLAWFAGYTDDSKITYKKLFDMELGEVEVAIPDDFLDRCKGIREPFELSDKDQ